MKRYADKDKVLVAVDCIIFGFDQSREVLQLLLIKRNFEPQKGKWSLMGGFMQKNENLRSAAERVLHQLTGLTGVYLEQLHTFGKVARDPVERTVSVAYFALINSTGLQAEGNAPYTAQWFDIKKIPKLIFDHQEMVQAAIDRLQYRASMEPIGIELLPQKFTMRQLQKLHEAIYDQKLDKRNFIKKMQSLNVFQRLDEKDKSSSKKGSYLYTFKPHRL